MTCKIYKNSWDDLIAFLRDKDKEKGGVGLGYRTDESNIIIGFCIFHQLHHSSTFCDFNPDDMAIAVDLMNELKNSYQINFPLGVQAWVHTHPNLGIFLSATDRNTFATLLALDNRFMAIVIDAYNKEEATYGVYSNINEVITPSFINACNLEKLAEFWEEFSKHLSERLSQRQRPLEYITPANVFSEQPVIIEINDEDDQYNLLESFHKEVIKKNRKKVALKKVRGEAFNYSTGDETFLLKGSKATYFDTVESRDTYFKLALPAADILWEGSSLPSLLRIPLIKALDGEFTGYESGIRSGLMFSEDSEKIYRLKGCGQNDLGFVKQEKEYVDKKPHYEIRGCQFRSTCLREQITTALLDKVLPEKNILVGNKPLGWWAYYDFVPINAYCGLFETLGDLRLKGDVLFSLESKLPYFFKNREFELNKAIDYLSGVESSEDLKKESFKLTVALENSDFISFATSNNTEIKDGIFKELIKFASQIRESIDFVSLYWKFGAQAGYIKKHLEEIDLVWGSFLDPRETHHCNAHCDNLILNINNSNFLDLSPVDFDLSFSRENFIQLESLKNDYCFDNLLKMENEMLKADITNCSEESQGLTRSAKLEKPYHEARKLLRNVMLKGYQAGYSANIFEKLTPGELFFILQCLLF